MFAITSTEKSKAIPPQKFAISTGSFSINFTSHAIKLRQRSIERDIDLHVVIECLKKNVDNLRSKEANKSQRSADYYEIVIQQTAGTTRLNNSYVKPSGHATDVSFAEFCMEMFNGGK